MYIMYKDNKYIVCILLLGWILIDRSGIHFGEILNFLRDGSVPLPETRKELLELLQEAKYYLVQDLVRIIEAALKQMDAAVDPICKVPLITSGREEQHLITNTQKVYILYCYAVFALTHLPEARTSENYERIFLNK